MSEALLNEKVGVPWQRRCNTSRPPAQTSGDLVCEGQEFQADEVSQWDHCMSTLLIRSTLGAGFGVIFSVLLFKRRSWPVFTGLGFGAGRAWEECDSVRASSIVPFWCKDTDEDRLAEGSLRDGRPADSIYRASSARQLRLEMAYAWCGLEGVAMERERESVTILDSTSARWCSTATVARSGSLSW